MDPLGKLGRRSVGLDDSVCAVRLSSFFVEYQAFQLSCYGSSFLSSLPPSLPPALPFLPPFLPPWVTMAQQMTIRVLANLRASRLRGTYTRGYGNESNFVLGRDRRGALFVACFLARTAHLQFALTGFQCEHAYPMDTRIP